MNILILHSRYKKYTGEEIYIDKFEKLLLNRGHKVVKKYYYINTDSFYQKFRLLFTQNFNLIIVIRLYFLIKKNKIEIVNLHNPYPYVSYAFVLLKRFFPQVKFIHTVHNYRHFCANGLFYNYDNICQKCLTDSNSSLYFNCQRNKLKTIFFFLRYKVDVFLKWKYNFDYFLLLNPLQKIYFLENGIDEKKLIISHNFIEDVNLLESSKKIYDFIFVGRVSDPQKGYKKFHNLMLKNNHCSGIVCGDLGDDFSFSFLDNVSYVGYVRSEVVHDFMSKSRFLVVCSNSFEVFPNILLEAWKVNCIPIVPNYISFKFLCFENAIYYNNDEHLFSLDFNIINYRNFNFDNILNKYSSDQLYHILINEGIIKDDLL